MEMEFGKWGLRLLSALGLAMANSHAQSVDGGIYVPGPNNALTTEQARDGYQLLWNGKDFTGWKTFNASSPGANWAIVGMAGKENGALKSLNPDSNVIEVVKDGESIWTTDTTFQNFDWMVEWQATSTEAQNGGLLYRFSEKTSKNNNASAPEYQICNNLWDQEWKKPIETAGSLYELKPLMASRTNLDQSPNWTRAAGKWNQSRIICYNGHIAHFGNGLRLVEDKMGTPDWNARYKASKYGQYPYFNTIHPGSFFLQDHGQFNVKYRTVRVKRLTQNPWAPNSPYLNKAAAAKGDSTLIDTLTFATTLFPATDVYVLPQYAIAPKAKVLKSGQGVTLLLPEADGYSLRLHDVRGTTLTVRAERSADRIFVPAEASSGPGFLSLWKDGMRIQEVTLGSR
jgi:hypothetical protein